MCIPLTIPQLNVNNYVSGPSAGLTFLMERVLYLIIVLSMQNLSIDPMTNRDTSINIGQMKRGPYSADDLCNAIINQRVCKVLAAIKDIWC